MNTNFGTTIFERVAQEIAEGTFNQVVLQHRLRNEFSSGAQSEITNIMNGLSAGSRSPNHADEIARIRRNAQSGSVVTKRLRKVDVFLSDDDTTYLIDLKTAKPNVSGFEKYKQDMLEWAASILYQSQDADVRIIVAIPYNPYEPGAV